MRRTSLVAPQAAGWLAALIFAASSPAWGQPPATRGPSPEMDRLLKATVGTFTVVETHHARPGGAEWSARGTATYAAGPDGESVVERYQSTGPRGAFSAVAVIWWDAAAGAFRHFQCESGEPCGIADDRGAWEGEAIVFVRQVQRDGRAIRLEERFDFAEPDRIVVGASFSVDGAPPTKAMTIVYSRARE